MTELETHLLNALKRMEQQFSEQLKASEKAQAALQMSGRMKGVTHQARL